MLVCYVNFIWFRKKKFDFNTTIRFCNVFIWGLWKRWRSLATDTGTENGIKYFECDSPNVATHGGGIGAILVAFSLLWMYFMNFIIFIHNVPVLKHLFWNLYIFIWKMSTMLHQCLFLIFKRVNHVSVFNNIFLPKFL